MTDRIDFAEFTEPEVFCRELGDPLSVSTSPTSCVTNTSDFLYDAIRRRVSIEHPGGKIVSYDRADWEARKPNWNTGFNKKPGEK